LFRSNNAPFCARPQLNTTDAPAGCAVCALLAANIPPETEQEKGLTQIPDVPPSFDVHIHCGIQKRNGMSYESIRSMLKGVNIVGVCLFAPVNEIYDRSAPEFYDSTEYQLLRQQANEYLLKQAQEYPGEIYPFYFVWNDYQVKGLENFMGIKWHRHSDEPHYDYLSDKCEAFLQRAYQLQLPIILEEEKKITIDFIERVAGRTPIIIPHLGLLNGGYSALKRRNIWSKPNVYADCSLAFSQVVDFIETYGASKLILGSDYPFGDPGTTKRKILAMHNDGKISTEDLHMILYNNIVSLLKLK